MAQEEKQEETRIVEANELADRLDFEFSEEAEPEQEQPQEEPQEEAPQVEPQKEVKNPWARNRILEKEKKISYKKLEAELQEMKRMIASLAPKQEEEQEELPSLEDDPLRRLDKRLETQERKREEEEKRKEAEKKVNDEVENLGRTLAVADRAIQEASGQIPDYSPAMNYLVGQLMNQAYELDEVESDEDAMEQVKIWVNEQKIVQLSQNRNPAHHFYSLAKYFGYTPQQVTKQEQPKQEDPKEEIRRVRNTEEKTRTISKVPNSSPKSRVNPSKLNSENFNKYVDEGLKSGELKKGSGFYRTPKVSELIKEFTIDDGR